MNIFTPPPMSEKLSMSLYDTVEVNRECDVYFFELAAHYGMKQKSYAETNMLLSGCIPNGQAFVIESIKVSLPELEVLKTIGANHHEAKEFFESGTLDLAIGKKNYVNEGPLYNFANGLKISSLLLESNCAIDVRVKNYKLMVYKKIRVDLIGTLYRKVQ